MMLPPGNDAFVSTCPLVVNEWDTGHLKSFLEIRKSNFVFLDLILSEIEDVHFNEL